MTDKNPLPYGTQSLDRADLDAVGEALSSPLLTTGPLIEAFEAGLCKLTNARHAVVCSNGTAALHLACMALGIGGGDRGITSPISFLASANCIEYCGGQADFVDINPSTLCMSPEQVETYCETVTVPKVVIPVSFSGRPADLPDIQRLARKYGFFTIEDAAHAVGSEYTVSGTTTASGGCRHTDLAVFSFHPVKTITSGEGGAVMTNDAGLAEKLRRLRNHGMQRQFPAAAAGAAGEWYYEMTDVGYNYRLTDIQAALGISQLEKLPVFRARRRKIAGMYNRAFKDLSSQMITPPGELARTACPHLYPVQFKGGDPVRREVYNGLKSDHIYSQVHYIPIYWQPYYADKYGYARGKCPNAEAYYAGCLSLPLFPAMSDDDVHRVVNRVRALLENC